MPIIPPREPLRAKTEKPGSWRFVVISVLLIVVSVAVYGVILAVVMERTVQISVILAALSTAVILAALLLFILGSMQRRQIVVLEAGVRERTRELDAALKDAERLNEGLSRANTKLGIAIESLEHGVIVFDLEKSVTMINGRARSLFDGSSPALPTFSRIAERLRPYFDFEEAMEKCFSSAPVELGEVRLGDGHFDARCLPLMSGGASFGTLLFLMDVTAQNKLERVRTEFTAMLVHEIRTPLTNMRWTIEAVMDSLAASSEEAEQLAVLLRSAASMRALVDDILDLSKIEAGKFEISPKENDLGAVIAAKVQEFRSQAEAKGLALSVSGTGPLPRMTFDEVRIGQALANLLSNALKFTEKGSVTVAAAFDAERGRVRVSVSDTGSGIPADGRAKLFQKYVQLGGSKDKNMGIGLGLAIVKGIIEAHGGAVGVGSEEGKGSAFWFELPAANGVRS